MPLFGGNSKQQQSSTKSATSIFRSANELLRHAAAHGDLKVVQELIAKGAKCLPDRDGRTALHFAAIRGSAEIVRFLLENGCELNVQDKLGYTALQRASIEGHTEVVRILLDGNAAIDLQDVVVNLAKDIFFKYLLDFFWHTVALIEP